MSEVVSEQNSNQSRETLDARLTFLSYEQMERLARHEADHLKLPYANLVIYPINSDILEIVPRNVAQESGVVLFYKHGTDIRLGAVNPTSESVKRLVQEIEKRFGHTVQVFVISTHSLAASLNRYRREKEKESPIQDEVRVEVTEVKKFEEIIKGLHELGKRIQALSPSEILNTIVVNAVALRASDIHVEPAEHDARLRFRIDGVLQDITSFERQGWALLLSRIKVLSKLKLNIRDFPQDGSFVLRIGDEAYDMRVSLLPGGYGENIVIRILDRGAEVRRMTEIGMKKRDFVVIKEELKRVNGMVLITGPTGSGKTTTLASFLLEVNSPEIKIITLEDPIEYHIPGIEQTQVDADSGYTFANGLRAVLRQDPDMVLVGEIRDVETAEVAVHAALTGHLVFTTLHANDAAGSVPRLVDMGVEPYILGSALNVVIAQRLVRIVCPHCAEDYSPDVVLRERVREIMEGVAPAQFDPKVLDDPHLMFKRATACPRCRKTGYNGRIGAFEVFVVEGEIEKLVLQGADRGRLREAALRQGMTTIAQDAFIKVIEGITTVEEVERISEE